MASENDHSLLHSYFEQSKVKSFILLFSQGTFSTTYLQFEATALLVSISQMTKKCLSFVLTKN